MGKCFFLESSEKYAKKMIIRIGAKKKGIFFTPILINIFFHTFQIRKKIGRKKNFEFFIREFFFNFLRTGTWYSALPGAIHAILYLFF